MPNPFLLSILTLITTLATTPTIFGGFFVLKIVVLFLMRGWSYIFTIKGQRPIFS
jgi:ABC-type phosphate transport system permease subunit